MAKFEDIYYSSIYSLLAESIEGAADNVIVARDEKQVQVHGKLEYEGTKYDMVLSFYWQHDGTEAKPRTMLRINNPRQSFSHNWGRFALWADYRETVEDMISGANNLLDEVIDATAHGAKR